MKSLNLNVGHVNVCSLENKTHDVASLLAGQPPLHVLGITESRLDPMKHDDQAARIPNYSFFRRDAGADGHTGIGAYVHHSLSQATNRRRDLESDRVESLWLEVRPRKPSAPTLIGFIYRNPKSLASWVEDFIDMMDRVHSCCLNIIILGDFNINLLEKQSRWLDSTQLFGLEQLITEPTRITQTSATLLDHIYTNNVRFVSNAHSLHASVSDHKPITCTLSCKPPKRPYKGHTYNTFRCFKQFNKESFLADLSQANFSAATQTTDPNAAAESLVNTLVSVVDKHAPLRRKRVKYSTIPGWLTQEIKDAMHRRDLLKKKKQVVDYKKQRNAVSSMVKNAKKAYFDKLIKNDKDISQIWKAMNTLSHKSRSPSTQSPCPFSAEDFNDHFVSVTETVLNTNNLHPHDYVLPSYLTAFCNSKLSNKSADTFAIPDMTAVDVGKIISSMENKKAMDSFGLNAVLIKLSLPFILDSLTYIYNLSIRKNTFPNIFKIAKVTPIPKSKDTSNLDNYRPISILSILSKPLEKHMHDHLQRYTETHSLLHPFQSGFRQGHSCETAVIRLCDKWLKAIDNRDLVGAVFLDLRKAFDLVNHNILVKKLSCYFPSHSIISFLSSYLSDREQAVCFNGSFSHAVNIINGVPQGSILGPLLFGIYINDMPLCLANTDVDIDMFADDSTLHTTGNNTQDIEQKLQASIHDVSLWCQENLMALHPLKTKSMLITSRQKHQIEPLTLNLSLNSTQVEQVHEHRLLGVIIDQELNWHTHIDLICKRVSRNLYLLSKLRLFVQFDSLKMFFFAHCMSHMNYCSTVWSNASENSVSRVNSLHRRGVKLLCQEPNMSTDEKFSLLNILPLKKQMSLNVATMMYKCYSNAAPPYLLDLLEPPTHHSRLLNYRVPLFRLDLSQRSFAFYGSVTWNSLPIACKSSSSMSCFKRSTKCYLFKS